MRLQKHVSWGSFQVPFPAQKRVIDPSIPDEQFIIAVRPGPVWGHPESNGQDAISQRSQMIFFS